MKAFKICQGVVALWVVGSLAWWPTPASATEVSSAPALAASVVEAPVFRDALVGSLGGGLPEGYLRDLATTYFEEDASFWELLEREMAVALKKELDEETLAILHAQYENDASEAWDATAGILVVVFRNLSSDGSLPLGRYLRRFGCQTGYLAQPSAKVVEEANLDGQSAMESPELKARLMAMMEASGDMCDCLDQGILEKGGEALLLDPEKASEKALVRDELITSGTCSDPFQEAPVDDASNSP